MHRKVLAILSAALLLGTYAGAQSVKEFKVPCDSLTQSARKRMNVKAYISAEKIVRNGNVIDFYFKESLGDFPWRDGDLEWLKSEIIRLAPASWGNFTVGQVYCKRLKFEDLMMPALGNDGKPNSKLFRASDKRNSETPLVCELGAKTWQKGLSGRYVALWQSHGRYFEPKTDRWEWQRATLMRTVEDMYTQSYVLPFLMPMLENAGAYCMTPRERDTQLWEIVSDNDPAFTDVRDGFTRIQGKYSETGAWKSAGSGFADSKKYYTHEDNPFNMGTARSASCTSDASKAAEARWTPDVPERGRYSVYISYKTLSNSTSAAHYTVHHLGGSTEFTVNQKMGGSTWIYLGTFEFGEGTDGYVTLDNVIPEGSTVAAGSVVTADAVKLGGGMGKIARGLDTTPEEEWTVSGLPAFAEGAMYWMQWAGVSPSIYHCAEGEYTCDYASRGAWVESLTGGSRVNRELPGKNIPVDLSFAFHTDAGTTPNDSIIGTLSIYTLMCDNKRTLPDGSDRMQGRELADLVQSQISDDVRAGFEPKWSRRFLWDRSYSESRTTGVPGMLLELLSHQNFADMKYGLDPTFRFTVSRAIYKGMLKFMSNKYGCDYAVQPLPVNSFAATFTADSLSDGAADVKLRWKATPDATEPTAMPTGYLLYTRMDDGGFDNGIELAFASEGGWCTASVKLEPGHLASYKLVAFNEGGKSFPSEILSVGIPAEPVSAQYVNIVNDFDRVSAPAWFDTPTYAGFLDKEDGGVGYGQEINFIGEQYMFRRSMPWMDDDCPGFGGSFVNEAGKLLAGNSFDYPSVHGRAIMAAGYAFCSASQAAFSASADVRKGAAIDIICGKQVTTMVGRGAVPDRFQVFPSDFQSALASYTAVGGNVIISGAYIGTDVWDCVYPVSPDKAYRKSTQEFVQNVLGYKWLANYPTVTGEVEGHRNALLWPVSLSGSAAYQMTRDSKIYCVENADGIVPVSSETGASFLWYTDTHISAGVCFQGEGYRTVSFGFPLETLKEESARHSLMADALEFISK